MSKRSPEDYLKDILEAIDRAIQYVSNLDYSDFLSDTKTQDAVIRNIEIIGEAVKNIPQELKAAHPDIAWKNMSGIRNKLIHEYFGVNTDIVWGVVKEDLQDLSKKIKVMIES